jgi:protoporphyrinogen/coproporphyrinogen III oxidase
MSRKEESPNSFQPSDPVLTIAVRSSLAPGRLLVRLLRRREIEMLNGLYARAQVDSELKDDLVFGDPNAPRFVLWEGKLKPAPSKPADLPFFDFMNH